MTAMPRIVGIDAARGLAVLGMMTAHVGPDDDGPVPPGGVSQVVDGRSAALFVVLAGVSLALLSGGPQPVTGTRLVQARVRVLVRGVLLVALGTLLDVLGTPVAVILPTYGLLFAVGCLALRLPPSTLLAISAVVALVGPSVRLAVASALETTESASALTDLAVGHFYPAAVWTSYLLTGVALGRLDLRASRVRRGAVLAGGGLVVLGYGGSWLVRTAGLGLPADLTTSAPHTSTTFEVTGNTGVALLVVAVLVAVAERWPRVLAPLSATGALALSAYTLHVVAIAALGEGVVREPTPGVWLSFLVSTLALCWAWQAWIGRGPFERLLHRVSTRAGDIAPDRLPEPTPR